jgi:undecaprenyl diphosphate synthase
MVVEESRRLGVKYLTLFAFSTENWHRPGEEVAGLMTLFQQYLESELDTLLENGVRLRIMGDRSRLPAGVRDLMEKSEAKTAGLTGMELVLAISYGGREEIVQAARRLADMAARGEISPSDITSATFRSGLYLPDVPDPDLLIRTSDEFRISNFLLWQLAYAEIVVSPVMWPEFSRNEFHRCLHEFAGRERRFGLTEEQVSGEAAVQAVSV